MNFIPNREFVMDRICRVCLQYKTDLFFIFDEQFTVEDVKMPELLTQCTRHNIEPYDNLPQNICGKCLDQALFVFQFQQQAEKSHQTLAMYVEVDDVNSHNKHQSTMENSTQTDSVSLCPCEMCGQKFFDSSDLIEHHLLEHPCKKEECNVCGEKFKRLFQLRNDIMQVETTESGCHLCYAQNIQNRTYENSKISLPETDEIGDQSTKDSIVTIDADFEEYETKVDRNDLFQYAAISIDDNYNYDVSDNVETIGIPNVACNENNSSQNPELSPRIVNEVLREVHQTTGYSYPVSSEDLISARKFNKETTETPMKVGTGLQQQHFSCHLCKRNFFTMEFLNKHLFEIHNHDLENLKQDVETRNLQEKLEELEEIEIKPELNEITTEIDVDTNSLKVVNEITTDKYVNMKSLKALNKSTTAMDTNKDSLNKNEPPDNSLLKVHHTFKATVAIKEHSSKVVRLNKEQLEKETHYCHKCNRIFARRINLLQHLSSKLCKESNNETFRCEKCNRTFARKFNLFQHLSSKLCKSIDNETFRCNTCHRIFARNVNLLQHLASKICKKPNNDDKIFRCKHCNRIFSRRLNLNQHLASKICKNLNNGKKLRCRTCGGVFSRLINLRQHLLSKVCEKINCSCSTCGKTLSSKQHLKRHMKIHTRTKECKCQYCDKSFSNELDLKMHERHHSKLKKIICKICGKHCHQPKYLKVHMRTHTGDRPFKCEKCLKTYTSIYSLNRHLQEAHGESYKCDKCDAVYLRMQRLREHIAAKH